MRERSLNNRGKFTTGLLLYLSPAYARFVFLFCFKNTSEANSDDSLKTSAGLVAAKANRRVRTVELDARTLVSCEIEQPFLFQILTQIRFHHSSLTRLPSNNFNFSRASSLRWTSAYEPVTTAFLLLRLLLLITFSGDRDKLDYNSFSHKNCLNNLSRMN